MQHSQITNEVDGESVRATRHDDGWIVVEVCPCDDDGYPSEIIPWREIARRSPDGEVEGDTDDWTEARTYAVNDALRLL